MTPRESSYTQKIWILHEGRIRSDFRSYTKSIMYFTVNEKFRKQLWLKLKTRIVNGKRSSETHRNMVEE